MKMGCRAQNHVRLTTGAVGVIHASPGTLLAAASGSALKEPSKKGQKIQKVALTYYIPFSLIHFYNFNF